MYCKYCGTKLTDNAIFCHACGKATADQAPPAAQNMYHPPVQPVYHQQVYQMPVQPVQPQPAPPVYEPAEAEKLEKQALTFGILGLSLSMLGVPGIIFSSLGGSRASGFKKLTGQLSARARTGHGLSKAGKIVSIVMTVVWALALPSLLDELLNSFTFDDPFEYFSF